MAKRAFDRHRLRQLHNRQIDAAERPFFRGMVRWFREQEREVLRRVRSGYVQGGLREGLQVADLTFDQVEEAERFGQRSVPYIQKAVELGAQGFFSMYGFRMKPQKGTFGAEEKKVQPRPRIEPTFDMDDPGTVAFIREASFDFWDDVHRNTKTDLIRELGEGMRAGETNRDIQRRVQGVFDGTTRGSAPRARMIARTEVNGAVNGGAWQAGLQSDVVDRKQWLSARDGDVRTTPFNHRISEIVKIKEVFTGTGEAMRFPGDPRGSVGNRVRCRCSAVMLAYEVPEVEVAVPERREPETIEEAIKGAQQEWEPFLQEYEQQKVEALRLVRGTEEERKQGLEILEKGSTKLNSMLYSGNSRFRDIASPKVFDAGRSPAFSREEQRSVRKVLEDLGNITDRSLWKEKGRDLLRMMPAQSGQRAYRESVRCVVHVHKETIFHEMAHYLEASNADVSKAAYSFLEKRTAGQQLVRLTDLLPGEQFGRDEMCRPDKFRDPYMGKVYTGRVSTEVLSMGIEQMRDAGTALQFWRDDPEHFYFTMAVLRGRIPRR